MSLSRRHCICVVVEPGQWAVDVLSELEIDPVDAPGVAAAAAAHFAHLDLVESYNQNLWMPDLSWGATYLPL